MTVKFEPQIKIADMGEVGVGGISTDLNVGIVEPVCVGFTGKDAREPYWDLRPKGQSLLGIRSFWLIVEIPEWCDSFRLTVRAQAEVQGFFGILPLTGKNTTREALPSVLIPVS